MVRRRRMTPRSWAGAGGIAAACVLSACSVYSDMEYRYRDLSLPERCEYFTQQAFPQIQLADTKIQSATDINTTTTRIEGINENAGATGQLAREVGVECRFENGILTAFRWTAGPFR
jgi:hypothetical protein